MSSGMWPAFESLKLRISSDWDNLPTQTKNLLRFLPFSIFSNPIIATFNLFKFFPRNFCWGQYSRTGKITRSFDPEFGIYCKMRPERRLNRLPWNYSDPSWHQNIHRQKYHTGKPVQNPLHFGMILQSLILFILLNHETLTFLEIKMGTSCAWIQNFCSIFDRHHCLYRLSCYSGFVSMCSSLPEVQLQ